MVMIMKLWVLNRLKSGIIILVMAKSQLRVTNVLLNLLAARDPETILEVQRLVIEDRRITTEKLIMKLNFILVQCNKL